MSNNVLAHVMLCGNAKSVIKQVRNSYFILSYFILSYFILSFSSCVIVCMRIIMVVLILMESGGLD